ncbi:MAG: 4-(cytidine 5'-diphospho)-2-C-methyl-D-erythritol kinase [Lentisphaeria bacterium]|nr:4-(cytidine 5'-diphospho)-2-C-methyl-D-erythritol kinase [Lentisphaeria bacterium]
MIVSAISGCKINWFLKVTGKRSDGYHLIETLFQYLPFPSDEITLDLDAAPGIRVRCGGSGMPQDLDNLAGKAAAAYAGRTGLKPAWSITIDKHVPAAAGLGGGSADAGAVLRLLNGHYGRLGREELRSLASGIGADVPFFLEPGLVLARGIGDELTRLEAPASLPGILIVFPGFPVSAKWAYTRLAPERISPCGADTASLLTEALRRGDTGRAAGLMHNDLEYALFDKFPLLDVVRSELLSSGAERVMVAGSGSSLFALFGADADREGAQRTVRELFRGDPEAKIFASGAWMS